MKRPQLIIRQGSKFVVDERRILPYMRHNKDIIYAAVAVACKDMKLNPDKYSSLAPKGKLNKLNDFVYGLSLVLPK